MKNGKYILSQLNLFYLIHDDLLNRDLRKFEEFNDKPREQIRYAYGVMNNNPDFRDIRNLMKESENARTDTLGVIFE